MQKQPSRGALMKKPPPLKKNASNPQENNHVEVRPQQNRRTALLKSHLNAGAPPQIHRANPKNTLPQEYPKRTASAYFKKSKLICNNNFYEISKIPYLIFCVK